MKTAFRKSFVRDLKKIKDDATLDRISKVIQDIESAREIGEIANCRKLAGSKVAFRIRIGEFRLGVFLEGETIELVRCLNRRDLYRYFP